MKACLDPSVAIVSPSLETRLLTGVALSAALGYYQSATVSEMSPELMQGLEESLPVAENVVPSLLDMITSLIAGDEFFLSEDLITAIFIFIQQGIVSFIDALLNFIGFV